MKTIRMLCISVLIVLIGFVAFSYWSGGHVWFRYAPDNRPAEVGTSGTLDDSAMRARGAAVGEKVAVAAEKVKDAAEEGAITSKIKAKMVLDDNIRARAIDVTTTGSTVTLSGVVRSVDEHNRAVKLARDTAGVTRVVDRLVVER